MRKFKIVVRATLAGLIVAASAAAPACAQMYNNFAGDMAMSRQLFLPVEIQTNRARAREARARAGGGVLAFKSPQTFAPGQVARPAAATLPTTYRRSPQVTEKVKRQYLDFARKLSPAGAAMVEADFRRFDFVAVWSSSVGGDGLRPGDVADALAGYWILNWVIANQGDSNRAQTLGVREQVRGMLPSMPAFARLTEAQRQEMAEALMLNFNYQGAVYGDAMRRGDKQMMAKLGEAARQRFETEMGVDLRKLDLTPQGFVARG